MCVIALAASAVAQTKQAVPIPSSPKPLKCKDMRGVIFCEVWLFKGSPETGIAGAYFNTTDFNNPAGKKNTCPADMWAKITVPELEKQYDVIAAFKNGPRGWTIDWAELPVGPVVSFDGLKTRWMGQDTERLLRHRHRRWLPGAFARRQNWRRRLFWPVQTHDQVNRTVGSGQPIRLLVRRSSVLLDVQRQRAVRILLQARQHRRRVDEVAVVDWVVDE